jgi:hypothetical protein
MTRKTSSKSNDQDENCDDDGQYYDTCKSSRKTAISSMSGHGSFECFYCSVFNPGLRSGGLLFSTVAGGGFPFW